VEGQGGDEEEGSLGEAARRVEESGSGKDAEQGPTIHSHPEAPALVKADIITRKTRGEDPEHEADDDHGDNDSTRTVRP
jgi:hypothetical protein